MRHRSVGLLVAAVAILGAGCEQREAAQSAETPTLDVDVTSACDVANALLRRTPGVAHSRTDGIPFDSAWHDSAGRAACRVTTAGAVPEEYAIIDSMVAWLIEQGWDTRTAISADGPDGAVQGLHRGAVTCVLEGQWDGGDDSDPAYVPSDTITVRVTCARLAPSDTTR